MTYPWTSGDVLTAADLNDYAGLVLIKTQTVGSGVSSVTVSGPFTSTFLNYRMMIEIKDSSSSQAVNLRFSGDTGSNYWWANSYVAFSGSPAVTPQNGGGATTLINIAGTSTYRGSSIVMDVGRAGDASSNTFVHFQSVQAGPNLALTGSGEYTSDSIPTSVTIFPASGTLTGGSIKIYGYNNG